MEATAQMTDDGRRQMEEGSNYNELMTATALSPTLLARGKRLAIHSSDGRWEMEDGRNGPDDGGRRTDDGERSREELGYPRGRWEREDGSA
jgi:hypothetical protein